MTTGDVTVDAPLLPENIDFATAPRSPPLPYPYKLVTPLKADAWHSALDAAGLLPKFGYIPQGLLHGFDVGLSRDTVDWFFSRSQLRYQIYDNHASATSHPHVIEQMIVEEQAEGRISEFFEPEELFARVGCFRNAPLTIAAKNGDFDKGRVCQDFSHPRNDPDDASFNAGVDPEDFTCDWGTFAQCYMLAAKAPPGAQVAVFDVKTAHRRIPVVPWQQPYCGILWKGRMALNHCCQFGQASASGLWGRIADGFRGIFAHRFPRDDCLNWADDFTFWRYMCALGSYDIDETDIYALGDELGWPWSEKKTTPFSHKFKYLGFDWDLNARTVQVTQDKADKYLDTMGAWSRGSVFKRKEAQSLLGKLVHCALVIPEGRSRLPALSKFAGGFKNDFTTHCPNATVFNDINWWCERLASPFRGRAIVDIPDPDDTLIFVDASTSFGIGIVLDDTWDHWKLREGWKDDSRDIGWAEMVAVEFGIRAAVERGASAVHLVVRSDNTGVVGALDAGKSRNSETNRALQRAVALMMEHSIWLSTEWVPSEANLADAPSRGLPAAGRQRTRFAFRIPFVLKDLVERVR